MAFTCCLAAWVIQGEAEGFRFSRTLVDLRVGPTVYQDVSSLFRGGIATELTREQWDPLVRIASSLQQRTAPAHMIVQRLAGNSPSDRAARALKTLVRVVKTIYILRYFHEEDIWRRVQL